MKKFFALASVTALAGVVFAASAAGCSSSSSGTNSGTDTDAGKDSGGNNNKDSGGPGKEGGGDDDGGGGGCPGPMPKEDPPWKTAQAPDTSKCNGDDIKFIQDEVKNTKDLTFKQLETKL